MYLSLEEARSLIRGLTLTDDALTILVDAVESEIIDRFGPYHPGPISQIILTQERQSQIVLRRRAATITEVYETAGEAGGETLVLDPADYRVDGYILERLGTGPTPSRSWSSQVGVVYEPVDDTASRKLATIDILRLETSTAGGGVLAGRSIGDYSESYAQTGNDLTVARNRILRRLGRLVVK